MAEERDELTGLRETCEDDHRARVGFEEFVRGQYRGLVRFLSRRTSIENAEEIAQESIISLLGYREKGQVSDWRPLLYRIAINHSIKHARRETPSRHGIHRVDPELVADEAPSPDEEAERGQRAERLQAAILALPAKCRRVYLLRHAHGLSHAQIAGRCGISTKTVEKHLATALLHLQRQVGFLREGGL
ncbi:RNA polymerase sigma factor [Luteimonas sp. SDU101]|uniref:RNA polymerase sigma factor n=1 Tax=Luteimonas sp. SDU101 TaxID=3422593 RepID=UPI003EBBDE7E